MEVLKWIGIVLVVGLALFGALALLGVIIEGIERLIARRGRDESEWSIDDDDFEADDVRSAAAQLEAEHDWWNMSLEGLESLPTFQLGAAALSNPETEVDEVVSLSRDADGWVASMALAALAVLALIVLANIVTLAKYRATLFPVERIEGWEAPGVSSFAVIQGSGSSRSRWIWPSLSCAFPFT